MLRIISKEFIIICELSNGNLFAFITNSLTLLLLLCGYLFQLVQPQHFLLHATLATVNLVFLLTQQLPTVGTIVALTKPDKYAHNVEVVTASGPKESLL